MASRPGCDGMLRSASIAMPLRDDISSLVGPLCPMRRIPSAANRKQWRPQRFVRCGVAAGGAPGAPLLGVGLGPNRESGSPCLFFQAVLTCAWFGGQGRPWHARASTERW